MPLFVFRVQLFVLFTLTRLFYCVALTNQCFANVNTLWLGLPKRVGPRHDGVVRAGRAPVQS